MNIPTDVAADIQSGPDLVAYLFANGHFNERDANNFATTQTEWTDVRDLDIYHPTVARAIHSWQSMRPDLPQSGIFDQPSLERTRREHLFRCGLPDVIPRQGLGAAWPDECKHQITTKHTIKSIRYTSDHGESIDDAWLHGLSLWNSKGDLTLHLSPNEPTCRICAHAEALGRYILAWSELAGGPCTSRLQQAYNSQISWQWHLLWTTVCHEIGHAIGIGHGGRGIMQPAHDPNVAELDTWDIQQLTQRYGQAGPEPPGPGPGPGTFHRATIRLFDAGDRPIAAYDVTPRRAA